MENEKSLIKNKKDNKNSYLPIILIIVGIVLVDQIVKIVITNIGQITLIENILKFEIFENTNAAYGIGSNSTLMYIVTNLVIIAIITKFITSQNEFVDFKFKILLSFIIAGGISNVIDRIIRGYVLEFINIKILNLKKDYPSTADPVNMIEYNLDEKENIYTQTIIRKSGMVEDPKIIKM